MAHLSDLPDELLLRIVDKLGTADLKALTHVTHFHGIAQEGLYRHIRLSNGFQSIPLLLRTLVHHPNLARCVRSLEAPNIANWDFVPADRIINIKMIESLLTPYRTWYPACTGLLLFLLPRLEHFNLPTKLNIGASFGSLYCRPWDIPSIKMVSVPALQSLVSLSIPSEDFGEELSELPKLRILELDCIRYSYKRYSFPIWKTKLVLERLTLRCTPEIFFTCGLTHQFSESSRIIRCFQSFKEFRILFTGPDSATWDMFMPRRSGTLAYVMQNLQPLSSSLEFLNIMPVDNKRHVVLDALTPSSPLNQFTSLKYLSLPHDAIIDVTEQVHIHPLDLLPPRLEKLTIYNPDPYIIEWLDGILKDRNRLPKLREIIFDFRFDPPRIIRAFDVFSKQLFDGLHDVGINLRYRSVESEETRDMGCDKLDYEEYTNDEEFEGMAETSGFEGTQDDE
ncbi:hypothetical protein P153DRAFT_392023 [Dothidotthia symphoricarpi CBS 119687]|uniref:F-box domain-containing protein n=1 Tax=Dothidotthia symphoricarpi CBS 119687 TaxID=1392245 RepID=A0A6A6ARY6_9PLEO|nr:uncharacterized protein P153DRAFT_392023 [Dothidotthia symphoricarpi CBS 119687]KAF2134699.1 hypothetical protein P153DRAFT_392023 [Dothidotthia symphoricarpi CBS 119687]